MSSSLTLKEEPSSSASSTSGQSPTTKKININNNNDTGSVKPEDVWLDNWGFPLDQLFKTAIKFFKDNEGKVFHPSYYERNQFLALVLLVKHGPFDPSKASPLGALDIVGRDRRQAWADLKDLSKQQAMSNFIHLLNSSCPSFKPYIEAHKREKEERDRQRVQEEEEEKLKKEKENQLKAEEEEEESKRKRPEEYFLQEEQRRAIKEALNNQTYVQFKSYAEQQYPNDLEQQNILITKLQEQHYEQYMQQIVQQRLISERMNGRSSISSSSTPSSPNESQNLESPLLKKEDSRTSYQSTTGYSNNLPSTSPPPSGVSSPSSSSGFYSSPSSATPVASSLISTNSLSQSTSQEASGETSSTRIYRIDESVDEAVEPESNSNQLNFGTHHYMTTEGHNLKRSGGNGTVKNAAEGGDGAESDLSDSGPEDFDSIEAPHMWTNKEIVSFKESIRQINGDGIIKVGHGEICTVRVPTLPEGTCIFWEFATDSYDIGFGVFFEWTKNPGTQVSVHISESEDDDEEEEDEIIGPTIGGNLSTDPEKGSHSSKCINGPDELPSAVIVPIYRRDCHEEVYAGTHTYPGKGAYLLKFDNSYSLWRSKTLYYRVYYNK